MLEAITLQGGTIEDAARYAIVAHYKKGNNTFLVTTKDKIDDVIVVLESMIRGYNRRHVSLKTRMKKFFFDGKSVPFMSNTIWVLEKADKQDAKTEKYIVRYPEQWNGETITLGAIENIIYLGGTDKTIISSEPLMWETEPYNQEINLRRKFG